MKFGRYELSVVNFGFFRLDGGSMFGSVPKNLWAKAIEPDAQNCIKLACRCLLLEGDGRRILVDVGMGEKWNDKSRAIYAIENTPEGSWGFSADSVTDVLLTHLHFDHAGGITKFDSSGNTVRTFVNAHIHLQSSNWDHARKPSLKDRASYLPENILPLDGPGLSLYSGTCEVFPDIVVHKVDGHTKGQQWVEVRSGSDSIMYATDLIPTSHHLPLPYHMGFDLCAETLLGEKQAFLSKAAENNAIVFFEHDPLLAGARVSINDRGHYAVKEPIVFS